VGVIETFSAASSIVAADVASKAAEVSDIRCAHRHGLGRQGLRLFTGDVGAVEAAVASGAESVAANGLLVRKVVIPGISPKVLQATFV
jgi:microcompartment protein CcmL/EutN